MYVYILGAGGLGREVAWIIQRHGMSWGFLSDDKTQWNQYYCGGPVRGSIETRPDDIQGPVWVVCGVGSPKLKRQFVKRCVDSGLRQFRTAVFADVALGPDTRIKEGAVICAGSVLTVGITLGKHVGVLGCTVGHDSVIGDYATLCPSSCISGYCTIEEGVFVGAGATILPRVRVGRNSIVGAGAVVTKDVPPNSTVVGVPARVIKQEGGA